MKPKLLLYLHGFQSSPQAYKAQLLKKECNHQHPKIEVCIPTLPSIPLKAWETIEELLSQYKEYHIFVVGASMGGFLASAIASKIGCKVVLINPLVPTEELLSPYCGTHRNPYTDEEFTLTPENLNLLITLQPTSLPLQNIWVLLETGDEVFDYHNAVTKYQGAKISIEEGGDHSFTKFSLYIPQIFDFFAF